MSTVAELMDRIGDLELARAKAWFRLEEAELALINANEELRDATILAARDPALTAALARLSTTEELGIEVGDMPTGIN